MIDGSKLYKKGRSQNTLEAEHAAQLLSWYQAYQDVARVSACRFLGRVAANDYNLNIPRYVEPTVVESALSVDDALAS